METPGAGASPLVGQESTSAPEPCGCGSQNSTAGDSIADRAGSAGSRAPLVPRTIQHGTREMAVGGSSPGRVAWLAEGRAMPLPLPAHVVPAAVRGHVFSISSIPAEQYVWQQVCGEAGVGALRFRWWLRHSAVQMLPEVSVQGWRAVSPRGVPGVPASSPLVLRVLAGTGQCDLAPTVDTSVVRSAGSPGAGRAGQKPWHPARGDAGTPPVSLEQGTSHSPRDGHSSQAARPPGRLRGAHQLRAGTWGAEEASQLPGHASAEAAQPPPAHCVGPAQLVLGSPGWGELVLPPQSRISCMGRASRHRPSPYLNPSLPARAGVRRRYPRGSPARLPVQPWSTPMRGAAGGPAPGSRAGVSDAAVGSDAAAGPGELVTAARRERPPSAPWLPGRAPHKANAAPVPGRSPG